MTLILLRANVCVLRDSYFVKIFVSRSKSNKPRFEPIQKFPNVSSYIANTANRVVSSSALDGGWKCSNEFFSGSYRFRAFPVPTHRIPCLSVYKEIILLLLRLSGFLGSCLKLTNLSDFGSKRFKPE